MLTTMNNFPCPLTVDSFRVTQPEAEGCPTGERQLFKLQNIGRMTGTQGVRLDLGCPIDVLCTG